MNNLRSILLTILLFALLVTPAFTQSQRISCQSGDFSIIAPAGWTLILDQDDLLAFQSPSKEVVMTFKKMPGEHQDIESFLNEYKRMIKESGAEIIAAGTIPVNNTKASKFNIRFKNQGSQAIPVESSVYFLPVNKSLYFIEALGHKINSDYSDVIENVIKSFNLE